MTKFKKNKKDFFDNFDYSIFQKTLPTCKHFGECGGCSFQNLKYEDQLVLKQQYIEKLFSQKVTINPSIHQLEYRNRMDFVYADNILGLKQKGNFKKIIDIHECFLMPEFVREIFTKIKKLLIEYNIPSYDFMEHKGFLRYVTFRYSSATKEIMIIFTSTTPNEEMTSHFTKLLNELKKEIAIKSIYWFHYDNITDVSVPQIEPNTIIGTPTIKEKIGDKHYLISPWSFFQVNTNTAKLIFDKIREEVSGNSVDLCCGVGAITLYVSDKVTSIVGIEEVSQAINLANQNKILNKCTNAIFFTANMKDFNNYSPLDINTLILDPPRAGLGKRVVQKIINSHPEKIIYMSCNPKTQKLDLIEFLKEGYEIEKFSSWDMFPQTPHIETLIVLKNVGNVRNDSE